MFFGSLSLAMKGEKNEREMEVRGQDGRDFGPSAFENVPAPVAKL